jgi:outer membrane receptor protein involved in Fe transport
MRDIGATDLLQLATYMPGATAEQVTGASVVDMAFRFRGVQSTFVYCNGYRRYGPMDPINLDRVEIVKGPSSFFGGQVQAGGFVNLVTKKPNGEKFVSFRETYGSFQNSRTEVEWGGAVSLGGGDKKLRFRGGAVRQSQDTYRQWEHYDKYGIFSAVDYRPFPNTLITFEYSYMTRRINQAFVNPLYLTLGPGSGNFVRLRENKHFNPLGPNAWMRIGTAQPELTLEQRITSWLSLRASLYETRTFQSQYTHTVGQTISVNATTGQRTLARSNLRTLEQSNQDGTLRADFLGHWDFARAKLKTFGGYERQYGKFNVNQKIISASLPALDIDNPSWDFPTPPTSPTGTPNPFYAIYESLTGSANLELFNRLTVLGGGRHDDGYSSKPLGQAINAATKFKTNSPFYGTTFQITPHIAVYASHSESFVPNQGFKYTGDALDPLTGVGTDIGVKFSGFMNGKLSGVITRFKQQITNARLADPDHTGFFITTGGTDQSEGVEADLAFTVKHLSSTFGYAYIDAYTVSNPTVGAAAVGVRPPNTPTHQFNSLNRYTFTEGRLKGLSVIAIGTYVGNRRRGSGVEPDTKGNRLPDFFRADLVLNYGTKLYGAQTNFSLGIRNILNKEYYISNGGYGDPRTFDGSIAFRF